MKHITDNVGKFVMHPDEGEPQPGSVVLTDGEHGNAWQRYASDGLWHRGKRAIEWWQLTRYRNVLLVHDAPFRDYGEILVLPADYTEAGSPSVECLVQQIAAAYHVHSSEGKCLKRKGAPLCA